MITNSHILVPVNHRNVQCKLMYRLMGFRGAMNRALLAEVACKQLYLAADHLETVYGPRYTLQVWDAYRRPESQQDIFDRYKCELRECGPTLTEAELDEKTCTFVSPATGAPPHACGGAVDLTLLIDGREAEMGTEFDAFVPEAAGDYYERHEPRSASELKAMLNRRVLCSVMEYAGFVPIPSEFWHWEFGTTRWADAKGKKGMLTRPLDPDGDGT